MQFEEKVDVIEEDIALYSRELLDILLKDRTTNKNIIWATSDYISYGESYTATEHIDANLITGAHSKLIQPRVAKAHEQKNSRTRDKAEVFTPSWICNAQNNLVDEHWFGHNTQLAIQQADPREKFKRLTSYRIIAAHQIGGLTAGNFNSPCIHILLPCVLFIIRKHNPFRCRPGAVLRDIKHIRPTKPMFIH